MCLILWCNKIMCNVFALPKEKLVYMDKLDLNCHISAFMVGKIIKYVLRRILMGILKLFKWIYEACWFNRKDETKINWGLSAFDHLGLNYSMARKPKTKNQYFYSQKFEFMNEGDDKEKSIKYWTCLMYASWKLKFDKFE